MHQWQIFKHAIFLTLCHLRQCVVVYSFSKQMLAHSNHHLHHYFDLCNRKFTKCDFFIKMMETIFLRSNENTSVLQCSNLWTSIVVRSLQQKVWKQKNCKLLHACELHASCTWVWWVVPWHQTWLMLNCGGNFNLIVHWGMVCIFNPWMALQLITLNPRLGLFMLYFQDFMENSICI